MSYPNSHGRDNEPDNYSRAFAIALVLKGSFVIIEAVCGFFVHSLALLADAGHNLGYILGLLIGWKASFRINHLHTLKYELRRSSILAALLNAFILLLVMGGVAWEAIRSFSEEAPVPGGIVIAFAIAGIGINTITALLFLIENNKDWNLRNVFEHIAADAMVAVGVLLAGIAILTTGWYWFDPAVSLIVIAFIVFNTWQILRNSFIVALDAVPQRIDPLAVRTYLGELPGVTQVRDLQIWGISTTECAIAVQLVMPSVLPDDAFLEHLSEELHDKFGIDHTTFFVESDKPDSRADVAPDNLV